MSVCSPTRISIMTGQNAARHRTTNWINPADDNRDAQGPPEWNWRGLTKSDVTLPSLLRAAGYRTIHVGKGHFGPNESEGADPLNLGFDVNVGGRAIGHPGSYYGREAYGKGGTNAVPHLEKYHGTETFLTEALTIEAEARVADAVAERRPFFLYMAHYAVHAPFQSDPRFAAHYAASGKPAPAQAFATLIEGMDKSLGACSITSTRWASPRTRSSSSSATTAPTRRSATSTRSPAPPRCAGRRARTTKAACVCRSSPRGRGRIRPTRISAGFRLPPAPSRVSWRRSAISSRRSSRLQASPRLADTWWTAPGSTCCWPGGATPPSRTSS